ncbi:Zinc finger protein BRUTUS-like [Gracilariopsis chorda]|uniref:Zinc finger protein BRUTUS-like n=1 Tax=Gracilariopsis chorda TaxID=448386 RepID=A0A2V3IN18_9FLOR|nr:Zinc finger protein BRUTUS-like [Gracilariopsis chorda]|eukprot:PXF43484.1 Zinc finger protein BRUTUS-like [Gracilariopsis chorda]
MSGPSRSPFPPPPSGAPSDEPGDEDASSPHSQQHSQWQVPHHINSFQQIQNLVRQISKDPTLSEQEKNLRRQTVFTHRFKQRRSEEAHQFSEQLNQHADQISYSTVRDPQTGQLKPGCKHYPRNCKLKAECCQLWVVCRHCHDHDSMDHSMVRYDTKLVRCMLCNTVQSVSSTCTNCKKPFARYFCAVCKFYDDTPGKSIYHCDKCKICRVGEGIGKDNFHCDHCDACVSIEHSDKHRCLKTSLDANCPICGAYLFTSTRPVVFMRCGHTMHAHCFDDYTMENFRCPLCQKSLTNMSAYYAQIDEMLKREQMPPEHRNKRSYILCHDCDQRSETAFHFDHHKCQHCGGYNTRVLRTFRRDPSSSSQPSPPDPWSHHQTSEATTAATTAAATAATSPGTPIQPNNTSSSSSSAHPNVGRDADDACAVASPQSSAMSDCEQMATDSCVEDRCESPTEQLAVDDV